MNKLAFFSQFIAALAVLCTGTATVSAQPSENANETPIVVELFTSKYCPACPAADRNFNALIAKNSNIIGLSCHVSYFNRPQRGDKLARPFCDARQNVYKLALKTGGIYTPMTIINGQSVTTGIKPRDLKTLTQKAIASKDRPVGFFGTTEPQKQIGFARNGQYLDINLPRIDMPSKADIWLFEIENRPGEEGYTHYRNAVKNITKLLRWNGQKMNMAFPATQKPGTSYALIIQTYKGGIIAAAQTP